MLLQVERVVLNALGKNTALAADICASRESLAIVFRTSRSTVANKEQCSPMHGKKKLEDAHAARCSGARRGERLYNNVRRFTARLPFMRRKLLEFSYWLVKFDFRSRRRVGRRFSVR